MGRYRKKPVVIEAQQYWGGNYDAILLWTDQAKGVFTNAYISEDGDLVINTLEGDMKVSIGDWVIRGVQGEFYPCKPDIFAQTYEPVES